MQNIETFEERSKFLQEILSQYSIHPQKQAAEEDS